MPRRCRSILHVAVLLAAGAAFAQPAGEPDHRPVTPGVARPLGAAEAQALLGKSVRTRDGAPAGSIRDFTLAGPGGPVAHAVLASGGLLGFGATLVLVPADRLRVIAAQRLPAPGEGDPMDVTIDITAAELTEAPAFAYGGAVPTLAGGR